MQFNGFLKKFQDFSRFCKTKSFFFLKTFPALKRPSLFLRPFQTSRTLCEPCLHGTVWKERSVCKRGVVFHQGAYCILRKKKILTGHNIRRQHNTFTFRRNVILESAKVAHTVLWNMLILFLRLLLFFLSVCQKGILQTKRNFGHY